jgi:hypothetical protein
VSYTEIADKRLLTKETILGVYSNLAYCMQDEYVKRELKNREERRAVLNTDEGKYLRLCLERIEANEQLSMETIEIILHRIGITLALFEESMGALIQTGDRELIMKQMASVAKLRQVFPVFVG